MGAILDRQYYDKDALMAEKRKLLRIKNDFQQQLILQTLLMTFIAINVIIIALFIGPLAKVDSPNILIAWIVAILEVVAVVIIYRLSLIASHRIAGPVYVFERALKHMAEGDISADVRLRKKDNFHESAEIFNQALAALRERIERAQNLAAGMSGDGADELRSELAKFRLKPSEGTAAEEVR
jgi:methyl-accepting chemotaxis protein